MWIQQFYNLSSNQNCGKIEHIQYKAELPKISAINLELNPKKFTKVKIKNSNCKLCKINQNENYDTSTPMGSGGVVQRIEKQKWSDLRGSNNIDLWHFNTRVLQAL